MIHVRILENWKMWLRPFHHCATFAFNGQSSKSGALGTACAKPEVTTIDLWPWVIDWLVLYNTYRCSWGCKYPHVPVSSHILICIGLENKLKLLPYEWKSINVWTTNTSFSFSTLVTVVQECYLDFNIENFVYQMDIQMIIFERKICVIAGTRTTDLQFSILAP